MWKKRLGKKKKGLPLKKRDAEARKVFEVVASAVESIAEASGKISGTNDYHLNRFILGYMKKTPDEVPDLDMWEKSIYKVRQGRIPVDEFVTDVFPQLRGWVNNLRGYMHRGLRDPSKLTPYIPVENAKAVRDALVRATILFCDLDSKYEICRQEKRSPSPVREKRRKQINLNDLWMKKCGAFSEDPEWVDSLFCALGEGNALASFIMRMRFGVPADPNRNIFKVLYNITSEEQGVLDTASKRILDAFLAKIDRRERFRWGDLAAVVNIMRLPGVRNLVDQQLKFYGISTEPKGGRESRIAKAKQSSPKLDMQRIWNDVCASSESGAPGKWDNTLFCAIGHDEPAAKMLAAMRFTVPSGDPQNHIVIKLLDMMSAAFQAPDPLTGSQSWTNWGIDKALAWTTSNLRDRIKLGEKISWKDLNDLYSLTQIPFESIPLIGSRISSYIGGKNLAEIVEEGANDSLNPRGIEFVPQHSSVGAQIALS